MRLITFLFCFMVTISTFAEREGGGGQSFYFGSNAFLRDISENSNCRWRSGNMIKRSYPLINDILESIKKTHWLTSMRLNEEFNNVKFCLTKHRLPPLSYNNSDDLYIFSNQIYDQPAINDNGIVFVDTNLLGDMPKEHQAFLFIHELLHNFFNLEEDRSTREPRLRELVMNIFDHYQNDYDYESFKMALDAAKLSHLETDAKIITEREFELYMELSLEEDNFEETLILNNKITSKITKRHKSSLSFTDRIKEVDLFLEAMLLEKFKNGDLTILNRVYNKGIELDHENFLSQKMMKFLCSNKVDRKENAWKELISASDYKFSMKKLHSANRNPRIFDNKFECEDLGNYFYNMVQLTSSSITVTKAIKFLKMGYRDHSNRAASYNHDPKNVLNEKIIKALTESNVLTFDVAKDISSHFNIFSYKVFNSRNLVNDSLLSEMVKNLEGKYKDQFIEYAKNEIENAHVFCKKRFFWDEYLIDSRNTDVRHCKRSKTEFLDLLN